MTSKEKKDIYRTLCDQGKITGLFMQPWWLELTGTWEVALGVRNGQIVGAMPFAYRHSWGLRKIVMPLMTPHIRLWMEKPSDISEHKWLTREKQLIWLILDDLPSFSIFSMVFEAKSFNNWLPFYWRGYRQEVRNTFVLDRLQYESNDYKVSITSERNVRDAGDELKFSKDVDLVRFYEMCQETYRRRKHRMPITLSQIKAIDTAAQKHQAGIRIGVYSSSNELLAATWLLWDKERAYYFMAGDNGKGKQLGASILLYHEAIRIAFEEKQVNAFEFTGSTFESFEDAQKTFGAKAQGLMHIWQAKPKWLIVVLNMTR